MLTKLRITNYRSIRGTVDFPLTGRGLILLNGEHDSDYGDSNGAGKSSTYMALMWCLFGWLGKKQLVNEVVNRHCDSCEVEVQFRKGNHLYTATRRRSNVGRGNTKVKLLQDTQPYGEDKSESAVTRSICEVLGVTKEAFLLTLLSDGKNKFIDLNDEKQKALLETLLEFDVTQFRGQSFTRTKEITERCYEINLAIEVGNAKTEVSGEALAAAEDRKSRAQSKMNSLQINKLSSKYSQQVHNLQEELGRIDHGYNGRQTQAYKNIKFCDDSIRFLQSRQDRVKNASLAVKRAEAQVTLATQEYSKAMEEVGCPSCDRAHTQESRAFYFKSTLEEHNALMASLEAEQTQARVHLDELMQELVTAVTPHITEAEWNSGDWSPTHAKWDKKKREHEQEKLTIEEERLAHRKGTQDQLNEANVNLGQSQQEETNACAELAASKDELSRLLEAQRQQNETIDLEALHEEMLTLNHESAVLVAVEAALRKDGLPAYIIETQLPAIEALANEYLSNLSPSALAISLEISHEEGSRAGSLNVSATNTEGAQSYHGLSKGEQERINITLLLALRKVVVDNHCDPGILFLDELIDGLDHTGAEATVAFLQELAVDTQIICISHNVLIKSLFPDMITIRREEGKDTVIDTSTLVHVGV